ncbi:adenosine receptor A1-like [Hyla sarda]|uniref:adenosine receptor A1-like n=1 Tax=Hyla sarda TaxID=327740 RepID=UPI0024C3F426|nr:adenosine receptor A1-like [Hyla sarda]
MNASLVTDLAFSLDGPYTAGEITIAVTAAVGNFLVCVGVLLDRKMWTVTNYFLVSLSVADMCVGAFAIPGALLTSIGLPRYNLELCLLMLSILIMLTMSSTFSLMAISVDRYIAILNPLRYKSIMTSSNSFIAIVIAWIVAFLSGLIPMMGWHKPPPGDGYCLFVHVIDMTYLVYFFSLVYFYLPVIIMFVIYTQIYAAVRKQLHGTVGGTAGKQGAGMKEFKTATSLFTIIFFFMLCWAPLHVMNAISLLCPHCYTPPVILNIGIILTHANSALNPIMYVYKLKSFRKSFKRVFLCRNSAVSPTKLKDQTSIAHLRCETKERILIGHQLY